MINSTHDKWFTLYHHYCTCAMSESVSIASTLIRQICQEISQKTNTFQNSPPAAETLCFSSYVISQCNLQTFGQWSTQLSTSSSTLLFFWLRWNGLARTNWEHRWIERAGTPELCLSTDFPLVTAHRCQVFPALVTGHTLVKADTLLCKFSSGMRFGIWILNIKPHRYLLPTGCISPWQ